jgi:hypothetical protein
LTVSISSFDALDSWDQHAPTHGTNWERVKKMQRRGESLDSGTDWDRVKEMIFAELTEYVPDMPLPGKNGSMCLVRNTGARLYLNDVHDWNWQPAVECEGIQNLFLAGEFVQNPIDAVTVESAVVTGLQAAEAIRKRAALEEPVEIIEPQTYPAECIRGAVQMLAPYALAAKSWTIYDDAMGDPRRAWEAGIDLWSKAADVFWGAVFRRDK